MAKTGGKTAAKSLGGAITSTGFTMPGSALKSSKYSPEDKAIEMMTKATEQAMNERGPNQAAIDKRKKQKAADHIR